MGVYATVADVRDLGLLAAEASDAVVEKYLTRAERRIDQITRDRFTAETGLTLRLRGEDGDLLFLPRRVRTITSVTVNGTLLASNEYLKHSSLNAAGTWFAEDGTYDALERTAGWPRSLNSHAMPIVVLGNFSWAATPEPITEACALMAVRRIRGTISGKGISGDVVRWTTETATFDRGSSAELRKSWTGWFDVDSILERFVRDRVHAAV